jgi:predicted ATPase
LDQSSGQAREAVERATLSGHLSSLVGTLAMCCVQAYLCRDTASHRDWVEQLEELAEAHGYPQYAARGHCHRGWLEAEGGRATQGVKLLERGLGALRAAGIQAYRPLFGAMLSDATLLAGDERAAFTHLQEALHASATTGEVWFDAELHRRLGGVLLKLGRCNAQVGSTLLRALEIGRSQSARLFELRAARDLARLWRGQGRGSEAHDRLASVYATFTEGFAFPDLIEVRALLEQLGRGGAFRR